MKKLVSAIGISMALNMGGCASFDKWNEFDQSNEQAAVENAEAQMQQQNEQTQPVQSSGLSLIKPYDNSVESDVLSSSANFQSHYKTKLMGQQGGQYVRVQSDKNINHYVRGIMQDLVSNLQYVNASTPMAVSSFVFLDSDYDKADLLGNQISEAFLHEIHKLGIPVIDFKAADYLRVTPTGDFLLTKDYLELSPDLPIRYVLTGTLVKHQKGYLVNARIVGIQSKAIVASAQGFVPNKVGDDLIMSGFNDGIPVLSAN